MELHYSDRARFIKGVRSIFGIPNQASLALALFLFFATRCCIVRPLALICLPSCSTSRQFLG
jgi:hypothetical protein